MYKKKLHKVNCTLCVVTAVGGVVHLIKNGNCIVLKNETIKQFEFVSIRAFIMVYRYSGDLNTVIWYNSRCWFSWVLGVGRGGGG